MKIERYFYTEALQERKRNLERWQLVEPYLQPALPLPDDEPNEPPYDIKDYYTLNIEKYNKFQDMVDLSIKLAEKIHSNLSVYDEDFCGYITFIGEQLMYYRQIRETKLMFDRLTEASDTVIIRQSCDCGEHTAEDIDGAVQISFCFDCYDTIELD